MEKPDVNANAPTLRPDEKRPRLVPLILCLTALIWIANSFSAKIHDNGKSFSEYDFNRATVTNNEDLIHKSSDTQRPTKKDTPKTAPKKTEKKDPKYCPT